VQQTAQLPAPVQLPVPAPAQQQRTVVASADPVATVQVAAPPAQVAAQVTSPVGTNVATVAVPVVQPVAAPVIQPVVTGPVQTASAAPVMATADAPIAATIHAHDTLHGGWMIQIGAFDDEDQAKQHLSDAQVKVRTALAAADPFTERVQKGDKSLYRARFAGFDKTTAESACKELKRSDFECMALKD
ncbi:MAG: SPOR domain-containing protein, partial [Xanthobacteraceae bacterium]